MATHRGKSKSENPQKSFDTRDCMKIEPPDNVFGVVKTGQTRGSSQGVESRKEKPQKGFYTHDCMKIEVPDNMLGVVKTEKTQKNNLTLLFYENRSTG